MNPSSRLRAPVVVLSAFLLAGAIEPAAAAVTNLAPVKDNTLIEEPINNSNGSGLGIYAGRVGSNGGGTLRRGVLAFDLTAIPAGSTINSATLELEMTQSPNVLARTVTVHRLSADWGEAGSGGAGQGSPAQVDDATWTFRFFNSASWTTPGGDFTAGASASQSVTGVGTYTWSGAGLVADAAFWLANPGSNFGWLLLGDESALQSVKEFSSREGFKPPKLTIDYTPSTTGVVPPAAGSRVSFAPPWPVPAAGAVRLAWTLPAEARVSLAIHDAAGRRVRRLLTASLEPAGAGTRVWDGRSDAGTPVAAGVYLARLVVDGESLERRIPVLR